VLLVESGGLDFDPDIQALYKGQLTGATQLPMDESRLRFLGGSTNHWDGHCRPLDPIDFETRSWVPHSGWPFNYQHLHPFYERAQVWCELSDMEYEPRRWEGLRPSLIGFDPARLSNRMWQFSPPTRFGERYRPDLEDSQRIRVLYHANVLEIVPNAGATKVEALRLKTMGGKEARVTARTFVLACGGIENARLLLDSDSVAKTGLGNGNDLVGRFFLEHPHAILGYAVPFVNVERFPAYYNSVEVSGIQMQVKPGMPEAVQREKQILNGCIDLGYGYDRSEGYMALRNATKGFSGGRMPDGFGRALLQIVGDLDGTAVGLYRRIQKEHVFWFGANFEQAPNPDSRVTLLPERNAIGARRARVDWQLSEIDKASTLFGCRVVGEELARLGMGRTKIDAWLLEGGRAWQGVMGHCHHMGTTRMHDDPKRGVVDRNGRVHGIGNLYVAGSSVFPTSGYANATLTIVALAMRLADHLKLKA
jgi:choline dehydrogenase-like flavoprotein